MKLLVVVGKFESTELQFNSRPLILPFRLADKQPPPLLSNFAALATRNADKPILVPDKLPAQRPKLRDPRYAESSIYPYLETNVVDVAMAFSQEPISEERSQRSITLHGEDTPFRHWTVMQRYVQGLVNRNGYQDLVSYNTTVELVEKFGQEWKITLRRAGAEKDYWWVEWFDAVVVASGHSSVPYVPAIEGLEQFEKLRPGSVLHSKQFRGKDYFQGKVSIIFPIFIRRLTFPVASHYCRSLSIRSRYCSRSREHCGITSLCSRKWSQGQWILWG